MAKKHKPFPTYNQFAEWISRNCDSCKKGFDKKRRRFRCDWEWKLCRAAIGNGEIAEKVAKAIGYLDSERCDLWQCSEWVRRKG